MDHHILRRAGLFFFVYSLLAGLAIQLIVVPQLFPQFDLGEGIVVLDSTGFNQIAKAKAVEIAAEGWSAWTLRPGGFAPAGIASAFYALLTPAPYSLLPFNALVHAISGCLVLSVLSRFFEWRAALVGSALFVVNPAALEWVAQIHRDGLFILGNLLVLAFYLRLVGSGTKRSIGHHMRTAALGLSGTALVWVARPFWVQVLLAFGMMFLTWMAAAAILRRRENRSHFFLLLAVVCLVVFQGWLVRYHTYKWEEIPTNNAQAGIGLDSRTGGSGTGDGSAPEPGTSASPLPWKQTAWIPTVIENRFYQMSQVRQGVSLSGGKTLVDRDVKLNSVAAFVTYFPRALQIGLLSPLPEFWGGEGSTGAMTLARKIMVPVTLVFYACLLSLAWAGIRRWAQPEFVVVLAFCLLGILIYAYVYPNIGSLMRFRYGFYMLLIGFGAAAFAQRLLDRRRRRQAEACPM